MTIFWELNGNRTSQILTELIDLHGSPNLVPVSNQNTSFLLPISKMWPLKSIKSEHSAHPRCKPVTFTSDIEQRKQRSKKIERTTGSPSSS